MAAVPHEPRERHSVAGPATLPAAAMHHGQALAEYMDALESATVQDFAPAIALKECQPQQHHHQRTETERVLDELLGDFEWWICDDGLAAIGHLPLEQEVAEPEAIGPAVVDEIRADHLV